MDPWGLKRWPDPGENHTVGRDGTLVPTGGTVGIFIENQVGSGWEFGNNHDEFVGTTTGLGLPDWLMNIPSMPPIYLYSILEDMCELSPEDRPEWFPLLEIKW